MLAMYAKRKIEKKATDTLEKELKKVSLSSPPQILAKDIEKAVAKSMPVIYQQNKQQIEMGLLKIAKATKTRELVHLTTDLQKKTFLSLV